MDAVDAFAPLPADPDTPDVERQLVVDILKRALWVAPVILAVCAGIWGTAGFLSALFGLALVAANLTLAAASLGWAARQSPAALMGVALFGFLVRMGLLIVAVQLVRDQSWVHLGALGATILVTHLGLLAWEMRYVSANLAHPGLAPGKQTTTEDLS
jgi:hypothetical protein